MRPATSERRELTLEDANLLERFFLESPEVQAIVRDMVECATSATDEDTLQMSLSTLTEALYPTSEYELKRICDEVFGDGPEAQ